MKTPNPMSATEILDYVKTTFPEKLGNYHAIIGAKGMCKCGLMSDGKATHCGDFLKKQVESFLRQALASHLTYVMGKIPEKTFDTDESWKLNSYDDAFMFGQELGSNSTTDKCLSILQAEINSLVGKDNESSL